MICYGAFSVWKKTARTSLAPRGLGESIRFFPFSPSFSSYPSSSFWIFFLEWNRGGGGRGLGEYFLFLFCCVSLLSVSILLVWCRPHRWLLKSRNVRAEINNRLRYINMKERQGEKILEIRQEERRWRSEEGEDGGETTRRNEMKEESEARKRMKIDKEEEKKTAMKRRVLKKIAMKIQTRTKWWWRSHIPDVILN